MKLFLVTLLLFNCTLIFGQSDHVSESNRKIRFPDVPGYFTMKCDLHQHTVFSDGSVWPNIRVEEAIRDGLDAVCITDHLEYQPHIADIPHSNRNRSWEIATEAARSTNLIVIKGSEITRNMPPGHANAIFIQDANKLLIDDSVEVFREARRQGAFVYWNHPAWVAQAPDGIARLTDMHSQLLKENLLDGIEIVNDITYSDEAVSLAYDHGLTMLGTSDIHGLIDWQYNIPGGGHRPVTLVFTDEKSEEGIREALFAGRTVVWFKNLLVGSIEYLVPLVKSSLIVESASYLKDKSVLEIRLKNISDADFIVQNLTGYTLHLHGPVLNLRPHQTTVLQMKTLEIKEKLPLKLRVFNAVVAPETYVEVEFSLAL